MITTSKEYYSNLAKIQSSLLGVLDKGLRVPSNEPIYNVDLNARTIKTPTFLSVAKDHTAETIYFKCDRYFGTQDLSETVCVIQYINANNDAALYPVPWYDIASEDGKIIFPWVISGNATAAAGKIKFSIRFYMIKEEKDAAGQVVDYKLIYNLNTQAVTSSILYGMDLSEEIEEKYNISSGLLAEINNRLNEYAKSAELNWIILDE